MTIWDLCIKRPVFTVMLVSAPIVMGAVCYMRLGVDLMPNVELAVVTVTTAVPGDANGDGDREKAVDCRSMHDGGESLNESVSPEAHLVQLSTGRDQAGQNQLNQAVGDLPRSIDAGRCHPAWPGWPRWPRDRNIYY